MGVIYLKSFPCTRLYIPSRQTIHPVLGYIPSAEPGSATKQVLHKYLLHISGAYGLPGQVELIGKTMA